MLSRSAALLRLAALSLVAACVQPEPAETPEPVAFVAPPEPAHRRSPRRSWPCTDPSKTGIP